jgi:hypothetical protein
MNYMFTIIVHGETADIINRVDSMTFAAECEEDLNDQRRASVDFIIEACGGKQKLITTITHIRSVREAPWTHLLTRSFDLRKRRVKPSEERVH